ncbi:hypothetical protein JYK14_06210 [Siccirubricoccus sp. KC 17139]|uniref:Cupin domain-containing protein n=1 Tax=Siccirubricoccus soli TaxID=2899147 RepID=A0ABT1D1I6_9PROT|nr:hypothetical protein [Siccirubricoccus soli]MCO6415773.1 hypothetical protein [Siccirubricoccus soli]MCP2681905.1 hypothetical protein [Siccirubricoccus soli]
MMWLAVHEEHLAGERALPPAAAHGLYLRRGTVALDGAALAEDSATARQGGGSLAGEGELWRFTLTREEPAQRHGLVLAHALARDPALPFVLRMDRVDFPPGAVTPKHGHAGPGIRRLLHGLLLAELGEERRRIAAGEAWFEPGPEPVIGRALAPGTAFIRCMALDAELLGQPSFRAWDAAEAAKPRGAQSRPFFDLLLQGLPT